MRDALILAMLAACGDDGTFVVAGDVDASPSSDAAPPACLARATHALTLDAGAFPPSLDHPSVLVHIPHGFDPTPPIDVVVYVHGFRNCITNVLGDIGGPCTPGGPDRSAFQLATQLAASGKNAILVLPEVAFDQASGDPGALGTAGGFRALLDETLANLPAPLGPLDPARVGKVIIAVHSGGYRAVAAMATIGDVPVDELWLFDALYGSTAGFDAWVSDDLAGLAGVAPRRRFADVYTSGGGTLANSQAMADRAAGWVTADPSVLVDDRTTATWTDDVYHHGLLFKLSALSHDGVPGYYFERMLATGPLAARGAQCQKPMERPTFE